ICIAIAQNQEANSFLMGQCEAFHYLGPAQQLTLESIRSAIESMRDPVRRTACAHRARQMVDGLGAKRIAHALLASS
uniref:hypothetical protein n=1 Tax=Chitinimonas sp. TaxID=1934313 RepID=UPI0035B049A3